jgi:hypothetical protein
MADGTAAAFHSTDAAELSAAWRHATSHVSAAKSGAQLLTRVFDIPYSYVVRHVLSDYLPEVRLPCSFFE